MLPSCFGVLDGGDGSGRDEGSNEEEVVDVFRRSKLDFEVEELDSDGLEALGDSSDDCKVLSRKEGEDGGLELVGDGGEHGGEEEQEEVKRLKGRAESLESASLVLFESQKEESQRYSLGYQGLT